MINKDKVTLASIRVTLSAKALTRDPVSRIESWEVRAESRLTLQILIRNSQSLQCPIRHLYALLSRVCTFVQGDILLVAVRAVGVAIARPREQCSAMRIPVRVRTERARAVHPCAGNSRR